MVENFKKPAFLFPGQGAQYSGMALDFYEASSGVKDLFSIAGEICGMNMKKLLSEDGEVLKKTETAQIAVTLANLSAAAFLAERGVRCAAAAGHSLGEYAALREAGVISVEDCFALVRERGAAMGAASGIPDGAGMAAVLGLPPDKVRELVLLWTQEGLSGLFAANYNSPGQTVVSGVAEALKEAESRFKEAGAKRFVPLKVSGPFHSPLLAGAAEVFSRFLETVHFNEPKTPVFSNVTGKRIQTAAEAKKLCVLQITSPVQWTLCCAGVASCGVDGAYETGPGRTLRGLWADAGMSVPCRPAGKVSDYDADFK
ncbi:MAG: ACP S-malonyltransferase [Spirochaetaceae bacterium]|jgi:[acyl-carrier-protein] S-malonyltransferase|nr:ACP S-malonyltransferase [Spirochaetaceae bacterium]